MGLDTVELIVSIEKYFDIEISDSVTEQLATVGDVAAWVGQQLGTRNERPSTVRATVAAHVQRLFADDHQAHKPAAEARPLPALLPDRRIYAHYAARLLAGAGLHLPTPDFSVSAAAGSLLRHVFGRPHTPALLWPTASTLADLINWTVALNYETLLSAPFHIQYDVEQAICGLTSNASGVSVLKINRSSRFTYDLGMD